MSDTSEYCELGVATNHYSISNSHLQCNLNCVCCHKVQQSNNKTMPTLTKFTKKVKCPKHLFFLQLLRFVVYSYGNIHFSCNFLEFWCIMFLKCMIRFPLSGERAEFIAQCSKTSTGSYLTRRAIIRLFGMPSPLCSL